MVARDVYRWALIKHAAANPDFRTLAFPMPHSKYIDRHDKGPERNLKSYRAARKLAPRASPLKNEVTYTTVELEAAVPKPSRSSKTSTYYVPFDSADSAPVQVQDASPVVQKAPPSRRVPPRIAEVAIRASSRKESHHSHHNHHPHHLQQQQQQQQQCRTNYRPPIRGVSMWFTAV